ncbi:MAG: hypothetical protein ACOH12_10040 [Parvibaculaceae bacterium]
MTMVSELLGGQGSKSRRVNLIAAVVVGAAIAAGGLYYMSTSAAQPTQGTEAVSRADIEGFRSAHFGMNEGAVRAAIATDFGTRIGPVADAIKVVENKVERTRILVVRVPDLFPQAGMTEIGYVLGYKSQALMQINLLWGTPVSDKATPEQLSVIATNLQRYFAAQGFAAKDVKANLKIAKGTMLVFQGSDAKGHLVQLIRRAETVAPVAPQATDAASTDAKKEARPMRQTLRLAYIADPKAPDTFQINKGAF